MKLRLSLYIVLFLHQTTTASDRYIGFYRCISYYSYIKPQPVGLKYLKIPVVYRTIPTSNHNSWQLRGWCSVVVYRTIPTTHWRN